jgi:ABC-2 type transport system ATP-binding protein
MEIVGIADRKNTKCSDLSTGLRQKMNIIRGFMTDPQVIFLDEPTLGLDVGASRDVRAFIRQWMEENTRRTLLLTTHYMAEADDLCDRVAIINQGKVLAVDSPARLKQSLQSDALFQIRVECEKAIDEEALAWIDGLNDSHQRAEVDAIRLDVKLKNEAVLAEVLNELARQNARILSLQKREPTLEDVFVKLVGQRMEEIENADTPAD